MPDQRTPEDEAAPPESRGAPREPAANAEEALRAEETREMRGVLAARHGTWTWNPATGAMHWSLGLYQLLGKRPGVDAPSYEALVEAIHLDDKTLFLLRLEDALKHGEPLALDHRIVRADGSVRSVHTEFERLPRGEAPEEAEQWLGVVQDQTPSRTAGEEAGRVVEAMPDVFWMTSLHFRETLYVSRAYEHLWGRSCEELYRNPRAFMESILAEDLELASRDLACRGTGCAYETDYRIRHPSGNVRWIHERGYPVRNAHGAVWAMAGTARDVTCQKEEEIERRDSEAILRNQIEELTRERERVQYALDELPVMIAWHDRAGRLRTLNKLLERELGWSSFELERLDILTEAFPDPAYREEVLSRVRQGDVTWRDLHIRTRSGAYRDYAWSYVPLGDGSSIGVGIDLHERRNMERRLRESEAKFRSVYESNAVPFLFWHIDGRVTAANDAYLTLLGYSREDLDAGRLDRFNVTPAEFRARDEQVLQEQLAGNPIATPYEKELLRKDGSRVAVLVGGALFPDKQSGVSFALDLSERKRAEDAQRRLNEELNAALKELRASQRHALEIEKLSALGTLAAGVAHELNNPLMGVMNYVDYARRLASEAEVDRVLVLATRELVRISDLLHNMLTFVRPSDEAVTELALEQVLAKALALMRPELDTLHADVNVQLDPELPRVRAKGTPLQQVFVNLLTNVRDALAQSHERHVWISAQRRERFVAVDVADSGPGVPAAIQEQIFDPFFTTKEPGRGTGLGLSMSRSIMLELGGDLILQAGKPGQGAVFTVLVPAAEDTAPTQ